MSYRKKNDGAAEDRTSSKKNNLIITIIITLVAGGPLVELVYKADNPDDRAKLDRRINELEKTVNTLEHQALMCTPKYAIKEEDPFEDIWP